MPIMDAVLMLDKLLDECDPDVSLVTLLCNTLYPRIQVELPNSVHAFQTAERIREKYPGEGTHDF